MLGGRDSLWSPSPAPLRPPFWGPNCCQRGCVGAQQSAGFYCQVVLNRVVPGVVCWWPHENCCTIMMWEGDRGDEACGESGLGKS